MPASRGGEGWTHGDTLSLVAIRGGITQDAVDGGRLPAGPCDATVYSGECRLGGNRSRASALDPAHRLHAAEFDKRRSPLLGYEWHHPARDGHADCCRRRRRGRSHRRDSPGRPASHGCPQNQARHPSRLKPLSARHDSTVQASKAGPWRGVDVRADADRTSARGREPVLPDHLLSLRTSLFDRRTAQISSAVNRLPHRHQVGQRNGLWLGVNRRDDRWELASGHTPIGWLGPWAPSCGSLITCGLRRTVRCLHG